MRWAPLAALLAACSAPPKSEGADSSPASEDTGYRDSDGDGHPDVADCGPADPTVFPGAQERCNEIDDDCDGVVDEDATDALALWLDADGDGFGDPAQSLPDDCSADPGSALQAEDCDDSKAAVNPAASEICWSGQDDNCDGDAGLCGPSGRPTTGALSARWRGELAGDQLGAAVVWVADPMGSGRTVLVAGAPGLAGGRGGLARIASPLESGGLVATTAGAADVGLAGTALAVLGDINSDGLVDLLVGAPGADAGRGQATIWWGDAGGLAPGTTHLTGLGAGDATGAALSAGDLDGDGRIDAVVGAPTEISGGLRGLVAIHSGPLDALTTANSDAAIARIHGHSMGGQTGASVAADGDINGDGIADLAVGAPLEAAGEVAVWFGPVRSDQLLADADRRYIGDGVAYEVGRTVAWAGDTDGDGGDDLLVSAPQGSLDGAVVLFYSRDLSAAGDILGAETVGAAITGTRYQAGGLGRIGDVSGDGLPDIHAGGPGIHWSPLYGGIEATEADLLLLPTTTELGRDNPGWLPAALSPLSGASPDLDADGHAEIIFAGPDLAPDGQTRAGEVQVLSSLGW